MDIHGLGVALVTPFDCDNKINYNVLDELIEYQIKNDVDFIVIAGTTGEASTLSLEEKKDLFKYVIDKYSGKIPLVAGTGSNNTSDAILLSQYASNLGYDGILVVTPYYNKCNEEGLFRHYSSIAKAVFPCKVILYNVPSRTGVDISVSNILRLSNIENIIGIKEANPSIKKIQDILRMTNNFLVFSGNDDLTLPILALGGDGVISVAANIIPSTMKQICKNKDRKLYYASLPLINELFSDVNPIMIKEALNYIGFNVGTTRLPLYSSSDDNIAKLHKIIDETL